MTRDIDIQINISGLLFSFLIPQITLTFLPVSFSASHDFTKSRQVVRKRKNAAPKYLYADDEENRYEYGEYHGGMKEEYSEDEQPLRKKRGRPKKIKVDQKNSMESKTTNSLSREKAVRGGFEQNISCC